MSLVPVPRQPAPSYMGQFEVVTIRWNNQLQAYNVDPALSGTGFCIYVQAYRQAGWVDHLEPPQSSIAHMLSQCASFMG